MKKRTCYVCGNNSDASSYFSFRKAWASLFQIEPKLNPDDIPKSAKLCDKHFIYDDFVANNVGKIFRLRPDAKPTVQLRVDFEIHSDEEEEDIRTDNKLTYDYTALNYCTLEHSITPSISSQKCDNDNCKDCVLDPAAFPMQEIADSRNTTPSTSPGDAPPRLPHVGGIPTPDLCTPRRAKRCLQIANSDTEQERKLIKESSFINKRVKAMKDLVEDLRDKDILTEHAKNSLIEGISNIFQQTEP